jgi:hypothetical protein
MEPYTIDRQALRRELVILALCVIAFVAALIGLRWFIIAYVTSVAGTPDVTEIPLEEINSIPARTLTGTVVNVASDGLSVRVVVPEEGVYTIGIGRLEEALRTELVMNPGDIFTFYVTSESAVDAFDFAAHAVEVAEMTDSLEARLQRIESMGRLE